MNHADMRPGNTYRVAYALHDWAKPRTIIGKAIAFTSTRVEIETDTGKRYLLRFDGIRHVEEGGRQKPGIPASVSSRDIYDVWRTDPTLTLAAIGEAYGVTRERVRQIVRMFDPHKHEQRRRDAARDAIQQAERDAEQRLLEAERQPTGVCALPGCETLIYSEHRKTCSTEHAELWRAGARYHADPDKHRVQHARTVMRYVDKYRAERPKMVEWAERILAAHEAGEPLPERNRTYVRKTSELGATGWRPGRPGAPRSAEQEPR